MTQDQVGQLLMVGIPDPSLDRDTRAFLKSHDIGGVILFRRNVTDVPTLARLTADLHAIRRDRPILVAIDHEGGRVSRLHKPFTAFPAAAVVGRAGSPHLAYRQGVAMGEELRSVGIDIDFAPVLDVATNAANPVIGDRSFGAHPRMVSRLGISFAHGMQRSGVIPCGKHFPGHGDTDRDSHLELPVVHRSFAELERTEIFPFRRAIQGGLDVLMTAHVVFTALDSSRPATFSPSILGDLLRERLHFRGVLFSDDLEMKAIADRHDPGESAILALEAGVDWLMFGSRLDFAEQAIEAVRRAAPKRALLAKRMGDAAERIDALRRNHHRRHRRVVPFPAIPAEGVESHQKLVRWIEQRAARSV